MKLVGCGVPYGNGQGAMKYRQSHTPTSHSTTSHLQPLRLAPPLLSICILLRRALESLHKSNSNIRRV